MGTGSWSLISMQPQLGISKGTARDSSKETTRRMELDMERELRKEQRKLRKKYKKVLKQMGKEKYQSLVNEIISVERERSDLLGRLTPTFSLWKEIDSQTTWTIATKEPATATTRDDENQLAEYFNLMLQDMEDLGHRMLSMLYFLNKSNDPICSYKATELCNTAAKLNMQISKGFGMNHEPEQEPEPEPGQINLSTLFSRYYRFPNNYENTLAKLDTREEETKCEDVKVKKTKEEEDKENDPSTIEYFKKSLELDQYFFAKEDLNWPLKVYGKIAARDTVDRNRNILFSRSKCDYQEPNGQDDSLCLTGPSRAIVALGHVDFEVELKVIEGAVSQSLIICGGRYGGTDDCSSSSASVTYGGDGPTFLLSNHRCTTEVTLEQLDRSHQATIVGVRVTKGAWPIKYGCWVICFWAPASTADVIDTTCRPVVLLDRRGKGLHRGSENYLQLSRKVVSVQSQGTLRVAIEAYGKSRRWIARKGHIDFPVQQCQTSKRACLVGDTTVEVVLAWSLLS
ncbi:uncharacterized protein LOC125530265 [Triticum urartu]|uniref:uncharacterized protein LOC125530265 n=1 Tax=Triticum urartu TaxID=4572 RepID=UPI0020444A9A|nr:uncharacterized protein LOC125530265 [Triticum urartu]